MDKLFNVSEEIRSELRSLNGNRIVGLYAPQCIIRQHSEGKNDFFLGEVIYVIFSSKKTVVLNQYDLTDLIFINKNNNLKLSVHQSSVVDLVPNILEQGFYIDFIDSEIVKVEIHAYLYFQQAEDDFVEIKIKDEIGNNHYFIDIRCSYLIRFFMKDKRLNIFYENERYFPGCNNFMARFRIIEDIECDKILSNQSDEGTNTLAYKKIFSS